MNPEPVDQPERSSVVILEEEDFALGSSNPTVLKNKNYGLVLFHVNNRESFELARTLLQFASDNVVPVDRINRFVATCNLELLPKVANAFLSREGKFNIKRLPCFIVYQKGYPVSFWEGASYTNNPFTVESIGNFFTFEVSNPRLEFQGQSSRKSLGYYSKVDPFLFGDPYTAEERKEMEYNQGLSRQSRYRSCDGDACYILKPTRIGCAANEMSGFRPCQGDECLLEDQ